MSMYTAYVHLLKAHPLGMAALQFMLLGTLGDWLAAKLRGGRMGGMEGLCKLPTWAILGITVKYAFLGGTGATGSLLEHGFLPGLGAFGFAFYKSLIVNTFYGPFMMIGHRLSDDYLARQGFRPGPILRDLPKARLWPGLASIHWDSMRRSLSMIPIFWVPAHTLTFLLPEYLQVTMAAVWAIALGVMLGTFSRAAKTEAA
ncbi:MAG: hypothetical protein ACM3YO_06215 [Bacteroidota bacterium]